MSGLSRKSGFNRKQFDQEIYQLIQEIPAGRVLTYGLLARLAGFPQYSRLAGQTLAHVPPALHLPCHRVVDSQGRTAPHWPQQQALLEKEGIVFHAEGRVNLKIYLWDILRES